MKSVVRSGMTSRWVWVPAMKPLPQTPPEPMAIIPWMMWNPLPSGSRVGDRKSTRLNSSHLVISYAVFCLKKKKSIYQLVQFNIEDHEVLNVLDIDDASTVASGIGS